MNKKMIDWLYSKGDDCSDFQKKLRLYMFLGWAKDTLNSLKFTFDCSACNEYQWANVNSFCPKHLNYAN